MKTDAATQRMCGKRDDAPTAPVLCRRTDTEIHNAAMQALAWDVPGALNHVEVKVEDGLLTVRGEAQSFYQRDRAALTLQRLAGVKGIHNEIHISAALSASEVIAAINSVLAKGPPVDCMKVHLQVSGKSIVLTGSVHSWADRERVSRAAWSAPGIGDVLNFLTVAL